MAEEDDKIKKSLRYSILDGSFYSAMVGFGESFFAAFAVMMKATSVQLGMLDALPKSLGSLSQLFSNRLVKYFKSRKRFVYISALLEGLMYIPIALIFFLGTFRIYYLIFFVCIYWTLGLILNPAWSSWMGDLVSDKERGAYFGKRNKIAGLTTFFTFLAGGYLLQAFSTSETMEYIGFAVLFGLALGSRILSVIMLTKKFEPEYKLVEEEQFSLWEFIKQAKRRNYGRFVLYLNVMNFAVYASSPFFTAYMLYDLKMNYLTFTIVTAASLIVKYLTMPIWGRFSDRFGTRKILSLTGFLMPLVPILWLFSAKVWYLLIIQAYSGFVWAGFELSSFNFTFDTTTPQKRATCVAYYNALNGIAIFTGAMFGSFIVKYNHVFWSKYMLIFLLSGLIRYCASFIFVPKLREVRPVEPIAYHSLLFKISTTGAAEGLIREIGTLEKNIMKGTGKLVDFNKKIVAKNMQTIGQINKSIVAYNEDYAKKHPLDDPDEE
ncbi:MAG: MFS transporter [Candidatus Woesearchaeota archaeon]